jgi:tetratricopeptide (TPR) repeat protein
MFSDFMKKFFGRNKDAFKPEGIESSSPKNMTVKESAALSEAPEKQKNKRRSYKSEIKEKYGLDIPSSDTDKMSMGKEFEKEGELEKACACYEACLKNRFDGNAPYDRLIIIYRKLNRPKDVERVVKKAISVFEKVASQGRSDGPKKLEKFNLQLEKMREK